MLSNIISSYLRYLNSSSICRISNFFKISKNILSI
nr:MAG TPA: hypothetical protein [Caudoviricetes sp.]